MRDLNLQVDEDTYNRLIWAQVEGKWNDVAKVIGKGMALYEAALKSDEVWLVRDGEEQRVVGLRDGE